MIKFSIKDQKWQAYLFDTDEYEKKFGLDSAALTNTTDKHMYYDISEFDLATVIHEMAHAYVSHLHLESANLTADQMEEVMCEMFAHDGAEIIKYSKLLYRRLKKDHE